MADIVSNVIKSMPATTLAVNAQSMFGDLFGKKKNSNFGENLSSPSSSPSMENSTPATVAKIILIEPVNTKYPKLSASPLSQMIQFVVLAIAVYMACKCKENNKTNVISIFYVFIKYNIKYTN